MVCSLDWGVIAEHHFYDNDGKEVSYKTEREQIIFKTVFIEKNSFSATGCYGLFSIDYAKMINTYFAMAYNIKDDCYFD
jgi:hypothetical protein